MEPSGRGRAACRPGLREWCPELFRRCHLHMEVAYWRSGHPAGQGFALVFVGAGAGIAVPLLSGWLPMASGLAHSFDAPPLLFHFCPHTRRLPDCRFFNASPARSTGTSSRMDGAYADLVLRISIQNGFLLVITCLTCQVGYIAPYAAADDIDAAFPEPSREQLQAAEISVRHL